MIAHYGYFEDVSAVIDTCPLCNVSHGVCFSLDVDQPFDSQSVVWDQRSYCCLFIINPLIFLLQKIAVMHWSEPTSYNKSFELLCSWDFGLGANDLHIGTPFTKAGCLQWLSGHSVSCSRCSSWFLWGIHACRLVLPLHYHPLWHVTKRPGNKVGAYGWQAWSRI